MKKWFKRVLGIEDIETEKKEVEVDKPKKRSLESGLTPEEFLEEIMIPEKSSDHICWGCTGLKPVLKGSKFPPADIIGWCKKIHWPHYWCVADFNVVKKCYAFEDKKKK